MSGMGEKIKGSMEVSSSSSESIPSRLLTFLVRLQQKAAGHVTHDKSKVDEGKAQKAEGEAQREAAHGQHAFTTHVCACIPSIFRNAFVSPVRI